MNTRPKWALGQDNRLWIRPTTNKGSVWFNRDLHLVKQQLKNVITLVNNTLIFF